MKSISINHLFVDARPGGQVNDCLVESAMLSLEKRVDVRLRHNDKTYLVRYKKLEDVLLQAVEL